MKPWKYGSLREQLQAIVYGKVTGWRPVQVCWRPAVEDLPWRARPTELIRRYGGDEGASLGWKYGTWTVGLKGQRAQRASVKRQARKRERREGRQVIREATRVVDGP